MIEIIISFLVGTSFGLYVMGAIVRHQLKKAGVYEQFQKWLNENAHTN